MWEIITSIRQSLSGAGQLCQLANVTGIALRLSAYTNSVIPWMFDSIRDIYRGSWARNGDFRHPSPFLLHQFRNIKSCCFTIWVFQKVDLVTCKCVKECGFSRARGSHDRHNRPWFSIPCQNSPPVHKPSLYLTTQKITKTVGTNTHGAHTNK